MGYFRAGFTEIVGVDTRSQPRYPFRFVRGDALEVLGWMKNHAGTFPIDHPDGRREWVGPFDVVHASPPCQLWVTGYNPNRHHYCDLITPCRQQLMQLDVPYIIENVVGAPLNTVVVLCGEMFGLKTFRHRLFETSFMVLAPTHSHPKGSNTNTSKGDSGQSSHKNGATHITVAGHNFNHRDGMAAMDIDWMTHRELAQAIPPAYSEFLGRQAMQHLAGRTHV